MYDVIKKIAAETAQAVVQVKLLYGTVKSVEPLKIAVEQRMTLPAAALTLTATAQQGLAKGDRVAILAVNGQYLVLDRVV